MLLYFKGHIPCHTREYRHKGILGFCALCMEVSKVALPGLGVLLEMSRVLRVDCYVGRLLEDGDQAHVVAFGTRCSDR